MKDIKIQMTRSELRGFICIMTTATEPTRGILEVSNNRYLALRIMQRYVEWLIDKERNMSSKKITLRINLILAAFVANISEQMFRYRQLYYEETILLMLQAEIDKAVHADKVREMSLR